MFSDDTDKVNLIKVPCTVMLVSIIHETETNVELPKRIATHVLNLLGLFITHIFRLVYAVN